MFRRRRTFTPSLSAYVRVSFQLMRTLGASHFPYNTSLVHSDRRVPFGVPEQCQHREGRVVLSTIAFRSVRVRVTRNVTRNNTAVNRAVRAVATTVVHVPIMGGVVIRRDNTGRQVRVRPVPWTRPIDSPCNRANRASKVDGHNSRTVLMASSFSLRVLVTRCLLTIGSGGLLCLHSYR